MDTNYRVGTLKVQVMVRAGVTNERVTTRCISTMIDTATGWGMPLKALSVNDLERQSEGKVILLKM